LNDALKEFKENSKSNELKELLHSVKSIPLIQSSDTNSLSKIKHTIIDQEDTIDQFQQFIENIPNKPTLFISNQTKLSFWIILSIILVASAILLRKFLIIYIINSLLSVIYR
jgi:hypothetical protein